MPKLPLRQTVDASRARTSWRRSALTLATSTLVQGLAIATLIVTPLLVAQTMPEPASLLTLPPFIAVRVAPPIQRGPEPPTGTTLPTKRDHPLINENVLVPLPEIPEGIPENEPYFSGDPNGVPGGVLPWMVGGPPPTRPEPEPESEPEPINIGSMQPPHKIIHVNPVYPQIAARARIQGVVKLQAVIDARGRVADLTVIQSIPLLDRAAIEAVQQWRYQPTILNGRTVPVIMTVEVVFQLR